ncbi:hypothetical protein CEXT_516041 [Caerostris extrusa]|uniref:Uncharacterized protein n=1 Tax=Caerostris extrusa TaxID=172846 RepID=A0AAV4MV21_CAEEX|nr:hypothetical protein CEXT_516041 [Caerostris extrusa]
MFQNVIFRIKITTALETTSEVNAVDAVVGEKYAVTRSSLLDTQLIVRRSPAGGSRIHCQLHYACGGGIQFVDTLPGWTIALILGGQMGWELNLANGQLPHCGIGVLPINRQANEYFKSAVEFALRVLYSECTWTLVTCI